VAFGDCSNLFVQSQHQVKVQCVRAICDFVDQAGWLKQLQAYFPGNDLCSFGEVADNTSFMHSIWSKFGKPEMNLVKTMVAAAEYARHHYVRKATLPTTD
jgi:hypothetical protein